jgi:Fic family protein
MYQPSYLPIDFDFETKKILKKLGEAKAALAELRGFVNVIPNQGILISTLSLQEAKESSAVENIFTTHDEIFKAQLDEQLISNVATKEVQNYKHALMAGVLTLSKSNLMIKNECVLEVQELLESNNAGYRKLKGTVLRNDKTGEIIYEPPQDKDKILELMNNLLSYINEDDLQDIDPLIKMAIIHFQFESIHPFYDGNGRTGRILIILYLMAKGYLNIPVLYLSRFIIQNKNDYYNGLQSVRDNNSWEDWIIFILEGVRLTALDTLDMIRQMKNLMQEYKTFLRKFPFYNQDLLNNLFKHPYTRIEFVKDDLNITRQTASKYLKELASDNSGLVTHIQIGKFSYFINTKLFALLTQDRNLMLIK